jgi:hypothetical protein
MPQITRRHTSQSISQKTLRKHSKLLSGFIVEKNYSEFCPSQITMTRFICVVYNIKPHLVQPVAYPGILFVLGGSTNSVEDRERGPGGGSPLVRGSGGNCTSVQEISFHIVNLIVCTLDYL